MTDRDINSYRYRVVIPCHLPRVKRTDPGGQFAFNFFHGTDSIDEAKELLQRYTDIFNSGDHTSIFEEFNLSFYTTTFHLNSPIIMDYGDKNNPVKVEI
jgi:hypothetical protein